MDEHKDVISKFEDAGLLDGIRWAYQAATNRVLEDYSEEAGHDSTWLGTTRFILFRDRLDRVFSCERYSVRPDIRAEAISEALHAELKPIEIATMPRIPNGLVSRANLNGSPGWFWQEWRWLLASSVVGQIDRLPWPQKSPTKQRVAQQLVVNPAQASLFENDPIGEEIAGLLALREAQILDMETLVLAHAHEIDHDERELVLGRPQMNVGGGSAWLWREDLLKIRTVEIGSRSTHLGPPTDPNRNNVADAPVRLRRERLDQRVDEAGE